MYYYEPYPKQKYDHYKNLCHCSHSSCHHYEHQYSQHKYCHHHDYDEYDDDFHVYSTCSNYRNECVHQKKSVSCNVINVPECPTTQPPTTVPQTTLPSTQTPSSNEFLDITKKPLYVDTRRGEFVFTIIIKNTSDKKVSIKSLIDPIVALPNFMPAIGQSKEPHYSDPSVTLNPSYADRGELIDDPIMICPNECGILTIYGTIRDFSKVALCNFIQITICVNEMTLCFEVFTPIINFESL